MRIKVGCYPFWTRLKKKLQVFALSRLDELVDVFWAEIAESITKMCCMNITGFGFIFSAK